MQHQNQDLGRSHGHGGLHQAEGLHQERPTVKNKNAHQPGKGNLCKIYIRLMLAFKTPKNSLTARTQTIGLKMSKWSAQVTIVKTDMGQTSRQTGSMHVRQEVCQGGRVILAPEWRGCSPVCGEGKTAGGARRACRPVILFVYMAADQEAEQGAGQEAGEEAGQEAA